MMATGRNTTRPKLAQNLVDGISVASRFLRNVELPPGITSERLTTLATINEYGQLSVSDFANLLQVKVPTISRMLSSLEEDGLVRRKKSRDDGRGVLISLTPKGQKVYQEANRKSINSLRTALGNLSESQVSALQALATQLESLQKGTNK